MPNPTTVITIVTIVSGGSSVSPVAAPEGGFGDYETSGQGSPKNNADTVADILEANGVGDGTVRGDIYADTIPTNRQSAKNNQNIFHVHADGNKDADQIFFTWTWDQTTATLAIEASPPIKHK